MAPRPEHRAECGSLHALNIVASDRPGLLYGLARTLARYKLNLHTARSVRASKMGPALV